MSFAIFSSYEHTIPLYLLNFFIFRFFISTILSRLSALRNYTGVKVAEGIKSRWCGRQIAGEPRSPSAAACLYPRAKSLGYLTDSFQQRRRGEREWIVDLVSYDGPALLARYQTNDRRIVRHPQIREIRAFGKRKKERKRERRSPVRYEGTGAGFILFLHLRLWIPPLVSPAFTGVVLQVRFLFTLFSIFLLLFSFFFLLFFILASLVTFSSSSSSSSLYFLPAPSSLRSRMREVAPSAGESLTAGHCAVRTPLAAYVGTPISCAMVSLNYKRASLSRKCPCTLSRATIAPMR